MFGLLTVVYAFPLFAVVMYPPFTIMPHVLHSLTNVFTSLPHVGLLTPEGAAIEFCRLTVVRRAIFVQKETDRLANLQLRHAVLALWLHRTVSHANSEHTIARYFLYYGASDLSTMTRVVPTT